jgi:hypothetical protein
MHNKVGRPTNILPVSEERHTNCLIKNVTEGGDKIDTLTHKLMLPKEDSETEGYGYESTVKRGVF